MSAARDDILARIRAANPGAAAQVTPGPIPARGKGGAAELRQRFYGGLDAAGVSHATVTGWAAVGGEIERFLRALGAAGPVVATDDPMLDPCGLDRVEGLRRGVPDAGDAVSVTGTVAGIAETGTLMVRSGPDIANAAHFLTDTHVAVVDAARIVGAYEDAFALLRAGGAPMPRNVTLITGPSRSSDIERILQIGVHGPRTLHVVVCDAGPAP